MTATKPEGPCPGFFSQRSCIVEMKKAPDCSSALFPSRAHPVKGCTAYAHRARCRPDLSLSPLEGPQLRGEGVVGLDRSPASWSAIQPEPGLLQATTLCTGPRLLREEKRWRRVTSLMDLGGRQSSSSSANEIGCLVQEPDHERDALGHGPRRRNLDGDGGDA